MTRKETELVRQRYIYQSAKYRCCNPKNRQYKDYGGRGIKFTFSSFGQFIATVGLRPTPFHTIERIDNNGNYEPGNVRWATRKEQMRNQRDTEFIEYDGKRLMLCEWESLTGVLRKTIRRRMSKGWPLDEVFTPVDRRFGNKPKLGKTFTKMKLETAQRIREDWKTGLYKQYELARIYGKHPTHISRIINNRRFEVANAEDNA